ncbi:MAG: PKD domain-containing protein [Flavobacteriales bacterium]|nr:PKD domain-containing protein [Flavobacteriales bacterium]MBK7555522.1 PKD domain-containing protein [Flavobacteriales bacterium]
MNSPFSTTALKITAVAVCIAMGMESDAQSFRVKISTGMNGFYDETMVHFGIGVPTVDPNDIPKIGMGGGAAPGIASVSADGADLMFNAHGPISGDISVPIKVSCGVNGAYTLTIYDVQGLFGVSCITLVDQLLQTSVPVAQGMAYNYFMNTAAPIDPARFLIHMSAPLQATTTNATCPNANDGIVSVPVSGVGPWSVMWPDAQTGQIVLETFTTSPIDLIGGAGNYSATVSHSDGCTQGFIATIGSEAAPIAAFAPSTALAQVGEIVTFSNNSTIGTDANWSFGDGGTSADVQPTHAYSQPGIYTVSLTANLNGCEALASTLVEVEDANAVGEISPVDVAVFVQADRIMVTCAETDQPLNAELFSASGRSVSPAQRSLNSNSPMYVSTSGLPAGGYILRVWNSTALRSFLVPLTH